MTHNLHWKSEQFLHMYIFQAILNGFMQTYCLNKTSHNFKQILQKINGRCTHNQIKESTTNWREADLQTNG